VEKRLLQVPADDEQVLRGFSRAPHHPPPRRDSQVVDRLLEIRMIRRKTWVARRVLRPSSII
jgi:hypothetical protein